MPYPFALPTTSHLTFQTHLTSLTHPSLPATVTTARNSLRAALKTHKRLLSASQSANLPHILTILSEYTPYLLALDAGLSGKPVSGEDIDITLLKEVEVEWRPTLLASPLPGCEPPRVKGKGLDYEIYNTLHTLSAVHALLARSSLLRLYVPSSPTHTALTPEARTASIQNATKHLLTAHSIHTHLLHLTHTSADGPPSFPKEAVDIHFSTQSCLAELSLAEATLLFVLKDDAYPALLQQSRDKNDREWMVKAPDIPRVRAHLFARLSLGAAEHAGRAAAAGRGGCAEGEGNRGLAKDLVAYCEDLRRVSRAKACRFLGVDAEASGKTGEGIAWLRAGMTELGMDIQKDGGEKMSFGKLKSSWVEKREDRKMEKGKTAEWGADAGKTEEGRVLEWLERKWTKQNDTMNVQIVPDHAALVASMMPSGREAFGSNLSAWTPKLLGEDVLARMRAPIDVDEDLREEQSSGDEVDSDAGEDRKARRAPAGTSLGMRGECEGNAYY
ncbi:hypothetical protein EPUS_00447 [Endocarpon pusillum Z07020]|uniref:pH-response regulator protein palC n=1 Tax=Endocarpon pusillum (strain Z07020 / HMAS-L-300199) TaxID=1263415 RepID=U1HML8_ENDPU|nr:uncharacterized protein EPUS_00447 [Endocarpon pusillum Z07020]ERF70259.1 hypothetical protein EPUS_00447 [Endocarpon pusillum Z07020]